MNPQYKVLSHFRTIFLITINATITTISETLESLMEKSTLSGDTDRFHQTSFHTCGNPDHQDNRI